MKLMNKKMNVNATRVLEQINKQINKCSKAIRR